MRALQVLWKYQAYDNPATIDCIASYNLLIEGLQLIIFIIFTKAPLPCACFPSLLGSELQLYHSIFNLLNVISKTDWFFVMKVTWL